MTVRLIIGDAREQLRGLPDESVHCVVTSPPYFGLRDYGVAGQIGLEPTPAEFVAVMVDVFREVLRVLRPDGTLWLNLGDSYAGGGHGGGGSFDAERNWRAGNPDKNKGNSNRDGLGRLTALKPKDIIGIPWRVAFALQADGWYLRQDIIWSKPNPMPESVTDRCTKAHEYLFLLSKSARYHYDAEAIAEASIGEPPVSRGLKAAKLQSLAASTLGTPADTTRNRRSVWTVATQPFSQAHFATFPPDLIEPCIKAGCPKDCCAKCGAPVVRQIEKTYGKSPVHGDGSRAAGKSGGDDFVASSNLSEWSEGKPRMRRIDITTGWSPSCSCNAGTVRGTVLDPFGGAGTTGLVADRLQRNAILIELNPAYAALGQTRITSDAPLFARVETDLVDLPQQQQPLWEM